jgi:hypothetical protein
MSCWVPVTAACPHCGETLRQLGGRPDLRAAVEIKFRARHFGNCPHNPALAAHRKEPACPSIS